MSGLNPTRDQIEQMRRENKAYGRKLRRIEPDQMPLAVSPKHFETWRSREFMVQLFAEPGGIVRMSVNRTDWDFKRKSWKEGVSWDDLQRLKAECGYGERTAVEVFPPDSKIVNVANMRHLWIYPEGRSLSFVWNGSGKRNVG